MNAITKFLVILSENWTLLIAIVAAIAGFIAIVRKWLTLSNEQKKAAAIEVVRLIMLPLVTAAEKEFGSGTGTLKRAKVFEAIFTQFPILTRVANLDDIIKYLDALIDENLIVLRKLLEDNEAFYDYINNTLTLTAEELKEIDLSGIEIPAPPEGAEKEE